MTGQRVGSINDLTAIHLSKKIIFSGDERNIIALAMSRQARPKHSGTAMRRTSVLLTPGRSLRRPRRRRRPGARGTGHAVNARPAHRPTVACHAPRVQHLVFHHQNMNMKLQ